MPNSWEAKSSWRSWADTPVRWGGPAVGIAVNNLVTFSSEPDVELLYAIPVFGLCAVGGVLLADLIAHPAASGVRSAEVTPRRIRDHIPRGLTASLGVQAVLLTALLVVAVATASTDTAGRAGRALSMSCRGQIQTTGPWPGAYYAWPVLGGLVIGTVVCALVLRRITVRAASDDQRRISSRATVGAWGLLVAAPLFAVSLTMAVALQSLTCGRWAENMTLGGLGLTAFVSALTAGWTLGALLLPQAHVREQS